MKNLREIVTRARKLHPDHLADLAHHLVSDIAALSTPDGAIAVLVVAYLLDHETTTASLTAYEADCSAIDEQIEADDQAEYDQVFLRILSEVAAAGSAQAWIDRRAASRGKSAGPSDAGGSRTVKVLISTLARNPAELRAIRNLIDRYRAEVVTTRLDLPGVVPADVLRDSALDLGDSLLEMLVHCVVVPRARRAFAATPAN